MTRKIHKILSCILLFLNPGCGLLIIAVIIESCTKGGYWWILAIMISCCVVPLTLKYHSNAYCEEIRIEKRKYIIWKSKISKTHKYIGCDEDGIEYWEHLITGKKITHIQ